MLITSHNQDQRVPSPQDEATVDTCYVSELISKLTLLGACPSPHFSSRELDGVKATLSFRCENETQARPVDALPCDWLRGGHVTQSEPMRLDSDSHGRVSLPTGVSDQKTEARADGCGISTLRGQHSQEYSPQRGKPSQKQRERSRALMTRPGSS